jgi:hypothetical protein
MTTAIPLLPLWAFVACYRVNCTFTSLLLLLLLLLFTIYNALHTLHLGNVALKVQHCNLSATAGKPRAHHTAKVKGSDVSTVGHNTVILLADVNTPDTGRGRE